MPCEELRTIERQARARWSEAAQDYDSLAAPLQGTTVVMTENEVQAIQDAADRATATHNAWIEALKPWIACMRQILAANP